MIIELRKKSQITIPKDIISELQLEEGDHLDISVKSGVITIEPVAVYSKNYVKMLEDSIMKISEEKAKYNVGPFNSVEEAIEYLESSDDEVKEENEK
jgi:AbrB family looped-hinge helix DNA binding protein